MFSKFVIFCFIWSFCILPMSAGASSIGHGFVHEYDQGSNQTVIKRGASLSLVNGFKIGMKLGVRDYVMQGTLKDMMDLLEGKKGYKATAQSIQDDSSWADGGRNVYVVVMNKGEKAGDLMFSRVRSALASLVLAGGFAVLGDAKGILESAGAYIEGGTQGMLDEIEKILDMDSAKERIGAMSHLVKERFFASGKALSDEDRASKMTIHGGKRLDSGKEMIAILTAYPSPPSDARAVIDLGVSTVDMCDIEYALSQLFHKKSHCSA